jgi:hypothetical protein
MSAVQSFVTRRLVVGSHPFSKAVSAKQPSWKRAATLSFLSPMSKKYQTSSSALCAETLMASENATDTLKTSTSTSCSSATNTSTILADGDEFVKPDRDTREYRYIRLPNNLQVLLVSTAKASSSDDKSAKVEAASVHVQAGHFDDTIPGLAHFHEHMLVRTNLRGVSSDTYLEEECRWTHHTSWCYVVVVVVVCIVVYNRTHLIIHSFILSFVLSISFLERKNTPKKMNTKVSFRNTEALRMRILTWRIPIITFHSQAKMGIPTKQAKA